LVRTRIQIPHQHDRSGSQKLFLFCDLKEVNRWGKEVMNMGRQKVIEATFALHKKKIQ
jgi:hypothetical protein